MQVRIKRGVRLRSDTFGGICYIPHRDDFFAANHDVYGFISSCTADWKLVTKATLPTINRLAEIGILETRNPVTAEKPYCGPAFLGLFPDIPTVSEPLVLNVFSTAYCPLRCIYCHADDLMQTFRSEETDSDLENIAATALAVPSIVAVITGGDPLTRPHRAKYLIEKIAKQKSLVLDTSGVGDLDYLLPTLINNQVHIRISLDAISGVNDKTRPVNAKIAPRGISSRLGAEMAIIKSVEAGLSTTVQTVISARNDNISELTQLRDWLISRGVNHWVLHVAISAGQARRIEDAAQRANKRGGRILPGNEVFDRLSSFIRDTQKQGVGIDIRCTDTNNTPNSVLLVNSKGDLYTEGYAHNGKVLLYSATEARPDKLKSLWHHIDRFGHACRYLNWNRHLYKGQSIRNLYYQVPLPQTSRPEVNSFIETESKYKVVDLEVLKSVLMSIGMVEYNKVWQRDEYYDNEDAALSSLDFVIRLRSEETTAWLSMKGPRFYTPSGDYSRIELEFEPKSETDVRKDLEQRNLRVLWYFEKRRTEYKSSNSLVKVMLDEIPKVGFFVEIEGVLAEVHRVGAKLSLALGNKESRNYKDVYLAYLLASGEDVTTVSGASF